ncbi:MAG: hypothetical protein KVP17_003685 [Porospora cf. gigantea B]|nr:MAG: hypothetical protein KVP17_003685 [Porospora cf. gigantea B]
MVSAGTAPSSAYVKSGATQTRNVGDMRRQEGTYLTRVAPCECNNCIDFANDEILADKYWLKGDTEKAIAMSDPRRKRRCLNGLLHRPPPPRALDPSQPKGDDYIGLVQRQLDRCNMENVLTGGQMNNIKTSEEMQAAAARVGRTLGSAAWTAEVVFISASSEVVKGAFFESRRIAHLLNMLGVEYFNVDIASATDRKGCVEALCMEEWTRKGLLLNDISKIRQGASNKAVCPQVLVDGVPVGTFADLETLHQENDLSYVLRRAACPHCLMERTDTAKFCPACGVTFYEIVSLKSLDIPQLVAFCRANNNNPGKVTTPHVVQLMAYRFRLGIENYNEADFDFGQEAPSLSIGFATQIDLGGISRTAESQQLAVTEKEVANKEAKDQAIVAAEVQQQPASFVDAAMVFRAEMYGLVVKPAYLETKSPGEKHSTTTRRERHGLGRLRPKKGLRERSKERLRK